MFTFRDMREQIQNIMGLGPISKVMGMMPGMPTELLGAGSDEMGNKRMRKMMAVMDSMTDAELDDDGKLFEQHPTRIKRIARGSGSQPWEINELLRMHGSFAGMVKKMGGKNGFLTKMQGV
jgi:signal recognition particle subunit SRP54